MELEEILRQLEVDLFEVVGDEFAPKQENGSPERQRLLGLLSEAYPIFEEAKQALDRWYASKFIELIEDSMPQGSYHVNTETLLAKIKKHFNV